jgi:hypothetical protein
MKEIHIVWDKVTAHSRFWAIVVFIGILPASAFYVGLRVERMNEESQRLTAISQRTLYQSEHGMCRISDCTLQPADNSQTTIQDSSTQDSSTQTSSINVISPKQGDRVSPSKPINVIWNTSGNFALTKVSILLLDSNGQAVSKPVVVSASIGSATIKLPATLSKKLTKSPYSILIQGATNSTAGNDMPFAYSGDFYL